MYAPLQPVRTSAIQDKTHTIIEKYNSFLFINGNVINAGIIDNIYPPNRFGLYGFSVP